MQDILCVPDGHLQTGSSPPPNNSNVPNISVDSSSDLEINTKELLNQSNRSDSGIMSATGSSATFNDIEHSNCVEETDNRSDCSTPDRKYLCPICEIMLTSQHEFTKHIRSHNNEPDLDTERGFICRICCKVLSSNASLDRHVLIHSGERPFKCTYCGDTFTTNGNMHRHIRTHVNKTESYESDDGSDSGASSSCKNIEYNNNKLTAETDSNKNRFYVDAKRKFYDEEVLYKNSRIKLEPNYEDDSSPTYNCAVCSRKDFHSLESLEIHLEDNHPDYPTKCSQCNQIFKNQKYLSEHRNSVHCADEISKTKTSVLGFKDLTFVDFSSQKFPIIARYECEKNLHRVSGGLKFQCEKCPRAFPCASSLEIHQLDCAVGLDLSVKNRTILSKINNLSNLEKDVIRNDFFARLDLQNKSEEKCDKPMIKPEPIEKSIDNNKDLADIQSIISMTTNGTLLQQLQTKGVDINFSLSQAYDEPDHAMIKLEHEEESQDLFAAEFRKMKLRGEFPCRLCKAVFPNLRALKGHNRAHFNGNNSGTYLCNMCPHSTVDKAALIRHMRTHNGDRPYECALCNYAFTTKANCERHLRNRHAKATRDDVKKSIIYHPSEDPSNDDINKILAREDNSKTAFSIGMQNHFSEKSCENYLDTPDLPTILPDRHQKDSFNTTKATDNLEIPDKSYLVSKFPEKIHSDKSKPISDSKPTSHDNYMPNFNFSPKMSNTSTPLKRSPKISVKNMDVLKDEPSAPYGFTHHYDFNNQVVDVALDLSTKKSKEPPREVVKPKVREVEVETEPEPEDLSKKSNAPLTKPTDILAQRLLKNTPKLDPAALYASQMAMYRNSFPSLHGIPAWPFAFNHLLLPPMPPPLLQHDPQEVKERLQRLQLCGGGMVIDNFAERLKNLHQQALSNVNADPYNPFKMNDSSPEPKIKQPNMPQSDDIKPLSLSIDNNLSETACNVQSPLSIPKSEPITSPNSVKMVIKNGVLMPKQKQRRYRTERPFSCEYCSARFTLRSNMERHIKQQHPQFWKQRQRTAIATPGRKVTSNLNSACDITIPNYEVLRKHEYSDGNDNEISDKIKYAILAQHLKAAQSYHTIRESDHKEEDEEDDCDLVIDEVEGSTKSVESTKREENHSMFRDNAEEANRESQKNEDAQDLVPVSRLLDNASQQPFKEYFQRDGDAREDGVSEEDEEGLVASGSTSDGNSGTDENRSESENVTLVPTKKKSAYSLAPNRVSCPYCQRKFPWTSSLRRHVLTHTGQKPFKCSHCPLLFTTKSNCDRHLLRKHGNTATVVTNDVPNNVNNYMMRNVPERPFKCSTCPSSTFSTYSNLKKHMNCKHSVPGTQSDDAKSQVSTGYEAGSSEDEKVPQIDSKTDWDKQINIHKSSLALGSEVLSHLQNSDLPFKCHLCENSFGERQDALDHIKDRHKSEYELLLSKNALDCGALTPEEQLHHDDNEDSEVRGKFPDYANRKVICAFCMRRFWSAEDLRRHMRTHTGERPFSCDICHRRFTLKHSMLRHRKKHNLTFESDTVNSDEDNNANVSQAFEKLIKSTRNISNKTNVEKTDESDGNEGSDLIGNLLGIRDRSIIDQVLAATADDAAKLLGVRGGERE